MTFKRFTGRTPTEFRKDSSAQLSLAKLGFNLTRLELGLMAASARVVSPSEFDASVHCTRQEGLLLPDTSLRDKSHKIQRTSRWKGA